MLRTKFDHGRNSEWMKTAALVAVAVALMTTMLGCCECAEPPTTAPGCKCGDPPAVHVMAFGVSPIGCEDGCTCVCPVPDAVKAVQGEKIWFVNTSIYKVTVEASAGTFESGDTIVLLKESSVLLTVRKDAPIGDFALEMAVEEPGVICPEGLGRPRIIIVPPPQSTATE